MTRLIRTGRAFVEFLADNGKLIPGLKRANALCGTILAVMVWPY